jgi:hypothetical protein
MEYSLTSGKQNALKSVRCAVSVGVTNVKLGGSLWRY